MIGKDEEFMEDNRNLFSELASFESNYLIRWTDVDDTFISIIIATLFILNSLFSVDGNWNGIILEMEKNRERVLSWQEQKFSSAAKIRQYRSIKGRLNRPIWGDSNIKSMEIFGTLHFDGNLRLKFPNMLGLDARVAK